MTKICSVCGKTKPIERFAKKGARCRLCLTAAYQCYQAGIPKEAQKVALLIVDNIEREVNGWTAADKDWIS